MRVAKIENGVVVEVSEINRPIADFPGVPLVAAPESVRIGFLYNGKVFTPHTGYAGEQRILASQEAKAALSVLDAKSIRSMREYITSKTDAPAELKAFESQAIIERAKMEVKHV